MRLRVWVSLLRSAAAIAGFVAAVVSPALSQAATAGPPTSKPQQPASSQKPQPGSSTLGGLAGTVLGTLQQAAAKRGQGAANQPPTTRPYQPPPSSPPPPGFAALPIAWNAAVDARRSPVNERGQGVTGKFVAGNRAAIDGLSLPVLLPGDPDLVANLRLFAHGDFYTVSSTSNGLSFVLTGQAKAFMLSPGAAKRLPGGRLSAAVPGDGIVIEGNDSGLDADISRFGASYNIALQCAKQKADPRCANEAYIRGVIARMTVVLPRAQ